MQTKTLVLIFKTSGGANFRVNVPNPKANLTAAEIQTAMNTIIAKNIFNVANGTPNAIGGAQVVSRDTTELITS